MKALAIAFSMYSKIPMPKFRWDDEDRKNAMFFFPVIGIAVGTFFLIACAFSVSFFVYSAFSAAIFTAVPVLVTGGIHLDGYMDTCDARASYRDKDKRLEILKDTHVGAFAVIHTVLYFIVYYGACTVLTFHGAPVVAAGFIVSRSICGILIAVTPNARGGGMLFGFTRDVDKNKLTLAMCGYLAAIAAVLIVYAANVDPYVFIYGFAGIIAAAAATVYCRHVINKEFGGITGDLAGYFIQICELFILLSQAVLGFIVF